MGSWHASKKAPEQELDEASSLLFSGEIRRSGRQLGFRPPTHTGFATWFLISGFCFLFVRACVLTCVGQGA